MAVNDGVVECGGEIAGSGRGERSERGPGSESGSYLSEVALDARCLERVFEGGHGG